MRIPHAVFPAALGIFLFGATAHASLFDQLVVFGDSLSDTGNAYIATGGNPPAPVPPNYTTLPGGLGRFTDGPNTNPAGTLGGIWHEDLAAMLGIAPAEPFLPPVNGTNYAVGGAQVLQNVPEGPFTIPSLGSQVGLYLSSTGGHADPNALYILWGGANDLYSAAETPGETPSQVTATESAMFCSAPGPQCQTSLVLDIGELAAAGAKNFLWLNLPQLATTPRGVADLAAHPSLTTAFTNASTQFSADMTSASAALEALLGVKIADVDILSLYQNIVNDPHAFGYMFVTGFAQGNSSANPDQYLFWDLQGHPTTTGHALIARAADGAVLATFAPEPGTWAFAAAGLLMAIGWRRRVTG